MKSLLKKKGIETRESGKEIKTCLRFRKEAIDRLKKLHGELLIALF